MSSEADRAFRDALRNLCDVLNQHTSAIHLLFLMTHDDLADWEAEMDNCYPNWPQ